MKPSRKDITEMLEEKARPAMHWELKRLEKGLRRCNGKLTKLEKRLHYFANLLEDAGLHTKQGRTKRYGDTNDGITEAGR